MNWELSKLTWADTLKVPRRASTAQQSAPSRADLRDRLLTVEAIVCHQPPACDAKNRLRTALEARERRRGAARSGGRGRTSAQNRPLNRVAKLDYTRGKTNSAVACLSPPAEHFRSFPTCLSPMASLTFSKHEDSLLLQLTPPQSNDAGISVSKGCYCFVIDVSGR